MMMLRKEKKKEQPRHMRETSKYMQINHELRFNTDALQD